MGNIFRWLDKKIRRSRQEGSLVSALPVPTDFVKTPDMQGTTFILYPANGGHVLEVRKYDRKTDTSNVSLHIIKRDEDMGEAIGKIITYEALQR